MCSGATAQQQHTLAQLTTSVRTISHNISESQGYISSYASICTQACYEHITDGHYVDQGVVVA